MIIGRRFTVVIRIVTVLEMVKTCNWNLFSNVSSWKNEGGAAVFLQTGDFWDLSHGPNWTRQNKPSEMLPLFTVKLLSNSISATSWTQTVLNAHSADSRPPADSYTSVHARAHTQREPARKRHESKKIQRHLRPHLWFCGRLTRGWWGGTTSSWSS